MITNLSVIYCDAPVSWQMNIQDPATPQMEGMLFFHNYIMLFLIFIGFLICWMLYKVIVLFNENIYNFPKKFTHFNFLEIVWTITPSLILILIAVPSFSILYLIDSTIEYDFILEIKKVHWWDDDPSIKISQGEIDKFLGKKSPNIPTISYTKISPENSASLSAIKNEEKDYRFFVILSGFIFVGILIIISKQ